MNPSKKLFSIIPENFFSPLASPGKMVYWECLEILFRVSSSQLAFGVERDILVSELEEYFSSAMAADIRDPEFPEPEDSKGLSPRDKANFMLRKLEACGWVYTDTDHSYVQRTSFRDYAIAVLRTLIGIENEKKTEYQGYIYAIYTMARASGNNALGLRQMAENTEALITGLKSLNANIKVYIDALTRNSSLQEILHALLEEYYLEITDKAYHRLMTADNVSKFRPEILERLEAHAKSRRYIETTAKEFAEQESISLEEARERTLSLLHYIIDSFRQMDDILEDINKKNSRYQRAAVNRARFLLTSGEDIRGQLREILSFLGEKIQKESLDFEGVYALEETDRLIRLFTWGYLDTDSLYSPIQPKGEFIPERISFKKPDRKRREEKRKEMEEKLSRVLTPDKITDYVSACLAGRRHILASELFCEQAGLPKTEILTNAGPAGSVSAEADQDANKTNAGPAGSVSAEANQDADGTNAGIAGEFSGETPLSERAAEAGAAGDSSGMPVIETTFSISEPTKAREKAVEAFVRIIYIRLYGQRKTMPYQITTGEKVEIQGFRFRDFEITWNP